MKKTGRIPVDEKAAKRRHKNSLLFLEQFGTVTDIVNRTKLSQSVVSSRMGKPRAGSQGKRAMSREFCAEIEQAWGLEEGWFDQDHSRKSTSELTTVTPTFRHIFKEFLERPIHSLDNLPEVKSKKNSDKAGTTSLVPFFVQVKGNHNYIEAHPKSLPAGAYALVVPEQEPTDGDLVVVRISRKGQAVIRAIFFDDGAYVQTLNQTAAVPIEHRSQTLTAASKIYGVIVDAFFHKSLVDNLHA